MREVNTFQLGSASGATLNIPQQSYAKGRRGQRHRMEVSFPWKNTSGSGASPSRSDLLTVLQCLFSAFTSRFVSGRAKRQLDTAITFDMLREMAIAMMGVDVLVQVSGVLVPLNSFTSGITVAAGATVSILFEVPRHYVFRRYDRDENTYALGPTQLASMEFEIHRGATLPANCIQDGNTQLTLLVDDFDDSADEWSEPPRLYLNDEMGRVSHGPGACQLFGLWERSAIGASTALSRFSLQRDSDEPLHDNVTAARVVDDASYQNPAGFYDLNLLQTVLWSPSPHTQSRDLPTGEKWQITQPGNDLQPMHSAWLYVPTWTEEDADAVSQFFTGPGKDAIKLVVSGPRKDATMPSHAAAHSPLTAIRPGQPGFDTVSGRTTTADGLRHANDVPASTQSAASGAIAATNGDTANAADVAASVATAIANLIPGGSGASRNKQPQSIRAAVVNKVAALKLAQPSIARLPH
jgi:hypothetical protein